MSIPVYQVDAFASKPFAGNPAAVCFVDEHVASTMSDEIRQSIAAEMNLSETAFLQLPDGQTGGSFVASPSYNLRWFTPAMEVPLCGHATLAAAAALFHAGNPSPSLTFHTKSGDLYVIRNNNNTLSMKLPVLPASPQVPPALADALPALTKALVGDLPVAAVQFQPDLRYIMVVLANNTTTPSTTIQPLTTTTTTNETSMSTVLQALPVPSTTDLLTAVPRHADSGTQLLVGAIVTTSDHCHTLLQEGVSDIGNTTPAPSPHFVSRFFAPWAGIEEDPVTGSAHSVLGPYWGGVLGRTHMHAVQCSPRRGAMDVDVQDDGVVLTSHAVVVMQGALLIG